MNKFAFIMLSTLGLMTSSGHASTKTAFTFRHLEALQPLDPLLTSNAETRFTQHTDPANLEAPISTLKGAIPVGTDLATAQSLLQGAGAKCRPVKGSSETCHYFDVQTRDEFVDAVDWYVTLQLDHDRVSDIAIDRTWTRD